jgi:hypothetical protein
MALTDLIGNNTDYNRITVLLNNAVWIPPAPADGVNGACQRGFANAHTSFTSPRQLAVDRYTATSDRLTTPALFLPDPRVENGEKVTAFTITPRLLMDGRSSASDNAWAALTNPIWESF